MTILKLGGYAFAGKYDEAVGSVVIFEDTSSDGEETKLKYLGHTTKVLRANRIFLKEKPKSGTANKKQNENQVENINDIMQINETNISGQIQPELTKDSTKL